MKFRTMLMAGAMAVAALDSRRRRQAADIKEVQMLHWWTSGGEAAALNVLKQDLAKEGYAWKDVPVAGGGGEGAMTALKAMVAAGNPPTASQILGYFALDYAEAGKLGDITVARDEGRLGQGRSRRRCRSSPPPTASGTRFRSTSTRSTGCGSTRRVMDKIGGTEPKTFDDFIALLDKAKAAGVIPLALGGQPWQEATMFDSVVAVDRRPRLLQEGVHRSRRERAEVGHDEEVVRQSRQAARLYSIRTTPAATGTSPPRW